ncbi:hypothetical protein ACFV0D_07485 [Streptomyces sp. NPDC059556]|uniref:hypothetical protein n=1 Tax=Streptomyces sp. NPDC059556 TaxID=3346863 RepID=UPI00367F1807
MNRLSVSGYLQPDTHTCVTSYPDSTRPFISLRLEGDDAEITLFVRPGSADALRTLAADTTEATRS